MSANANEQLLTKLEEWERAFNEDGQVSESQKVTISEAFNTTSASVIFPKVISNTLREAAEPEYVITPLFSTVRLGKARSFEFPAINAIQADEIAETQEYPEQQLAVISQVEGKVSKKGVKVAFSEEVISDSLWDIVGLHVRAAGRAMARLKEQIAVARLKEAAQGNIVFDNDNSLPTSGLDADGVANGTYTWEDLLDQAAVLMQHNKVPTDLIVHPLAWSIFLKGTFLEFNGGPAAVGNLRLGSKEGAIRSTAPLGLNTIVTPFVDFTPADGSDPAKTDIYLIDRNDIGAIMVRDDLSVDDWNDQSRDIRLMKMKERYDIVVYGEAENITLAQNVSVARSYDISLTKTVS